MEATNTTEIGNYTTAELIEATKRERENALSRIFCRYRLLCNGKTYKAKDTYMFDSPYGFHTMTPVPEEVYQEIADDIRFIQQTLGQPKIGTSPQDSNGRQYILTFMFDNPNSLFDCAHKHHLRVRYWDTLGNEWRLGW